MHLLIEKIVNIYIVYEKHLSNYGNSSGPALGNSLFGAVELVQKIAAIDQYEYSGYDIGFDMKGTFSFPTCRFSKNVITFRVDMNSSVHVDTKEKYILMLGEGPTQELDAITLAEEKSNQ